MPVLRAIRRLLTPPETRWGTAFVLGIGGLAGIIFWGGFNTAMEATNSMEFCISCHEMRENVHAEYVETIHYRNASGVRAICSDCHVPEAWGAKVVRKVWATRELYHHLAGSIDTAEKFEAHRATMAKRVWAQMEANDSRECRNCHSEVATDFAAHADPEGARQMQEGLAAGETCISCHKGIAHRLPDLTTGYLAMYEALQREACDGAPGAGLVYSLDAKDMFLGGTGGPADGRLLPATALQVLGRDGDRLHLRLEGWQQEGAERVIYARQGQRILSAVLRPAAIAAIERSEAQPDPETGLVWSRVALEFWSPAEGLVADPDALWAYGAEMYQASCSTCHSLHDPRQFLANQWIGNLKAMERFITLDDDRERFLLKYLQFHARDAAEAAE